MSEKIESVNEFVNRVNTKNIEHVGDIVVQERKNYGIGFRGEIDGKSVLGSVVLDVGSGEPQTGDGTNFILYENSVMEQGEVLFEGTEAIEAMGKLYRRTIGSDPFIERTEADISNDAM